MAVKGAVAALAAPLWLLLFLFAASVDGADTYVELLTSWGGNTYALTWTNPTEYTKGVKYEVSSHKTEQRWKMNDQKQIQTLDGWCLSTSDVLADNGHPVLIVVQCESSSPAQAAQRQWTYNPSTKIILNVRYGDQCLDADTNPDSGGSMHTWVCNLGAPSSNQQWRIQYPGYYVRFGKTSNTNPWCLTTNSDQAGGSLRLQECADSVLQYWKYDFYRGELRLGKDGAAVCLDSPGAGEGDPPHTWWCDANNANQHIDFDVVASSADRVDGHFRIRDTNWCITETVDGWVGVVKCTTLSSDNRWSIMTGKPSNDASCADKRCQNGGVCVDGACRCPVGTDGGQCETKAKFIGYETSHGYFLTVGASNYDLLFSVPSTSTAQQLFVFNAKTKQIVVRDRLMCLEAAAPSVKLAACDSSNALQRWWYNPADGLMHIDYHNLCLTADVKNEQSYAVSIGECVSSGKEAQAWFETEDVSLTVFSPIRNRNQLTQCWAASSSVGVGIALQECKSAGDQLWKFDTDDFVIRKSSNACVFATSQIGAKAAMGACGAEQSDSKFEYDSPSGLIRKKDSTLCASASADSSAVEFVACDPTSAAQQWIVPVHDNCKSPDFLSRVENCSGHGACSFGGCQCDTGWKGMKCSLDSCSDISCSNGGRCEKGKCQCRDGFVGQFCDVFVKCKDVKCLNGGACAEDGTCQCPVGYSGGRCQVRHAKVLLRTMENQAITLSSGQLEVTLPNTRDKNHVWIYDDAKRMFRSLGSPAYCLERSRTSGEFKAAQCAAGKSEQTFRYRASTGTLATENSTSVVGVERTISGRLVVVAVSADGSTESTRSGSSSSSGDASATGGDFVEIDRLDLSGSAIRSQDRSKCLHYSSDSKITLAECSESEELQQWEYHPQNGAIRLPRIGAPRCLAQRGTAVNGEVCDGTKEEQQFRYDWSSKRFRNRKTLACLDMSSGALLAAPCGDDSAASVPGQVLRAYFRSFCDVVDMCGAGSLNVRTLAERTG